MPRGAIVGNIPETLYRLLLRLFPKPFRVEFGEDVVQLFRDRCREIDGGGRPFDALKLWGRAFADLAVQAVLEHRRHAMRSSRSTSTTPTARGTVPGAIPPYEFEDYTTMKGTAKMLDILRQDIRFAFRTFKRNPGFTFIAMLTLALGIGANTAIFSLINGVLLRPLRFGNPSELVVVREVSTGQESDDGDASSAVFIDWLERNRTFHDMTLWGWDSFVMAEDGPSVSLDGLFVHVNFFSVLEVTPLFGRGFTEDDAAEGQRGNVIVISHALWRDRWGADPGIIGKTVRIDGQPMEIVGVMKPDVAAPEPDVSIWVPAKFNRPASRWTRHNRRWSVLGRLGQDVSLAQAQEDMLRISRDLQVGEFSDIYEAWTVEVVPLHEHVVGSARATLFVAFASVGLVLLIACVNIANMLLARAAVREREMALRAALGAGRQRITVQLLTESVLLSLGGGVIGVVFAVLSHRFILSFQPGIIPRTEELSVDGAALGFAVGIAVLTGLIFGLAPAMHGARVDVQEALGHGGSRSVTSGKRQNAARGVLVASQLALTTVLLCGAGLLIRTMLELQKVDPGFDPHRAVAARVFLSDQNTDDHSRQYFIDVSRRLEALPSAEVVGASSALPMDPLGINYDLPFRLEGQEALEDSELPQADYRIVTPGYFEALGVQLLSGRFFNEFDTPNSTFVALVNQTMARQVWPDQNPVGQRFYTPSTDWHWFEVVGVVGDTRYYGLDSEPRAEMYVAFAQVPSGNMTLVVRSSGDPNVLVDGVRREIVAHDPSQPSHSVVTLSSLVGDTLASERFYALVLGVFAAVALSLSAAGVYGVLSYWVNQRTHEIGVRMALGASQSAVSRLVVGHGMALTIAGLAVGLVAAFASTRVLSNTLFGVGATDPLTFGVVVGVLAGIALLACWIPAFRASHVNPMQALREE